MSKILIVDDNPTIVEIFKDFFSLYYDEVDYTTDSLKASDMICKNSYDIVISDLEMPHINGEELCNISKEYSNSTKFIIVTGSEKDISANVDGLFRKPVILRNLYNAIKGIEST